MTKNNFFWIIKSIQIIILISAIVFMFSLYDYKYKECTSNPLVFAAKQYEERTGHKFVGSGSFITKNLNSPILYFNSEKVTTIFPK